MKRFRRAAVALLLCAVMCLSDLGWIGGFIDTADAAYTAAANVTLKNAKWGAYVLAAGALGYQTPEYKIVCGSPRENLMSYPFINPGVRYWYWSASYSNYGIVSEEEYRNLSYEERAEYKYSACNLEKVYAVYCATCGARISSSGMIHEINLVDDEGYWSNSENPSLVEKLYSDDTVIGAFVDASTFVTYSVSSGKIYVYKYSAVPVTVAGNYKWTGGEHVLDSLCTSEDAEVSGSDAIPIAVFPRQAWCHSGDKTWSYNDYPYGVEGHAYYQTTAQHILDVYGCAAFAPKVTGIGRIQGVEIELHQKTLDTTVAISDIGSLTLDNVSGFTYDASKDATKLLDAMKPDSIVFTNGTEIANGPPADKYPSISITNCVTASGGCTLYGNTGKISGISGPGKLTINVPSAIEVDMSGTAVSTSHAGLAGAALTSSSNGVSLYDGKLTAATTLKGHTTAYVSYLTSSHGLTMTSSTQGSTIKKSTLSGAVTVTAASGATLDSSTFKGITNITATNGNITASGVTTAGSTFTVSAPKGSFVSSGGSYGGVLSVASKGVSLTGDKFPGNITFNLSDPGDLVFDAIQFNGGMTINFASGSVAFENCDFGGEIILGNAGVVIKNCASTAATIRTANGDGATILSGTYEGAPAVNSKDIYVKRGVFIDAAGTKSVFNIDDDSERITEPGENGTTITTVKLTNPPIIIDWEEFPGINLDIDMSAPIIEVVRNPTDPNTPTSKVTLTIRAKDPNGTDTKVSINGGAFKDTCVNGTETTITHEVTENQTVSIIAVDANGNTREYQVTISNIDTEAPEIVSIKQSTDDWTKNSVRLYVEAQDDVKLHASAYKFEHKAVGATSYTTVQDWSASKSYNATAPGTYRITVRDSMWTSSNAASHQVQETIEILNIDKTAPTVSISNNTSGNTGAESGVLLAVTAADADSGLSDKPFKWDDIGIWTDDPARTVYANDTYKVTVRDAVGNEKSATITVSNIITSGPTITNPTQTPTTGWTNQKVVLSLSATVPSGSALHDRAYSWDGGKTWGAATSREVTANGEYLVIVRDKYGNTAEHLFEVDNIDKDAPSATITLFKQAPSDWNVAVDGEATIDDYVWWIRVDASDYASGIIDIATEWNGNHIPAASVGADNMEVVAEISEPGAYTAVITDVAGNKTYVERTITAEQIGQSGGGGSGGTNVTIIVGEGTSAGYIGKNLSDLVFGATMYYDRRSGSTGSYDASLGAGIPISLTVKTARNTILKGYVTFGSYKADLTFNGGTGTSYEGNGRDVAAAGFIPYGQVPNDVRNGRITVVLTEYDKRNPDTLLRTGSVTLYTSVQVTTPKFTYSYNKGTGKITITASSSVAGLPESGAIKYKLDTGSITNYAGTPVSVGSATSVYIKVVDNVGHITEKTLDVSIMTAGQEGENIPTNPVSASAELNVTYVAGRSAEIYIIGGTRSNSEVLPSEDVFDALLGN